MTKKLGILVTVILLVTMTFVGTAMAAVPTEWTDDGSAFETSASKPTVCYDGKVYHMWYLSGDKMYYRTSMDLATWTDVGECSGYNLTEYDDNAFVVKTNTGQFYLWCTDEPGTKIVRFKSMDGRAWVYDDVVLNKGDQGTWDARKIDHPMVIKDEQGYKLYYQGSNTAEEYRIGLATADSITGNFQRANGGEPVLQPSTDGWDSYRVFQPWVVQTGGKYYMFYAANDKGYTSNPAAIGVATSDDGITWTNAKSPILGRDETARAAHPAVIHKDGTWHIWYYKGSNIWHATSVYNVATTAVTFKVTEVAKPGDPTYPTIIGVSVPPTLDIGNIVQGTTGTGNLIITNTGNVTEDITCAVTTGAAQGSTVEVTSLHNGIAVRGEATATVTVTAGQTIGEDSATITVTATAAQ